MRTACASAFEIPPLSLHPLPFAGGRTMHNTKAFIYPHEQAIRCQVQDHSRLPKKAQKDEINFPSLTLNKLVLANMRVGAI